MGRICGNVGFQSGVENSWSNGQYAAHVINFVRILFVYLFMPVAYAW